MRFRRSRLDRLRASHRRPAIDALVRDNLVAVVVVLLGLLVLAGLAIVLLAGRVSRLETRLRQITRGGDGASLEGVLREHIGRVEAVARDLHGLEARTGTLERDGRLAVQRVALVRYNPFEDTGGNQSFAIALLDANDDGLVVSSLHARQGTRVYAKSIAAGRSDAALSAEEAEALRTAMTDRRPPR
jgi:hypothetical protein